VVGSVDDEYHLLVELGCRVSGQYLKKHEGILYDILSVVDTDKESKEETDEINFDIY
jgi:hypothetical protein